MRAIVAVLAFAVTLTGCAPTPPTETPTERAAPPADATSPAPEPKAEMKPQAPAPKPKTPLDLYKEDVARHVVAKNAAKVYEGAPPHFLRSVVVLQIAVDPSGTVTRLRTLRTNGYADLEQTAHRSIKTAAPLPAPPREMMRAGMFEFSETWLFREDGQFQLRSLANGEQGDPHKNWDRARR